jgi:hypothetical protein
LYEEGVLKAVEGKVKREADEGYLERVSLL